jgi:hypothetical protein
MEILHQTFSKMKKTFSSNEFAKVAKSKGLTQQEVNNGIISLFLHEHAIQSSLSIRMWTKKDVTIQLEIRPISENKIQSIQEAEAINILKKYGYKIMKENTQWIEL